MQKLRMWMSLAVITVFYTVPVFAHHTLQKDISDLLGPQAWGIYFVIPVPFLIIGTIAFLIYRSFKRAERESSQSVDASWHPKLN
jgi:hypothetical protein